MDFHDKRKAGKITEREKIEKSLKTLRIVMNVIKNYKELNVPVISLLDLAALVNTLEETLLKDGLPEKRLKEITKELD